MTHSGGRPAMIKDPQVLLDLYSALGTWQAVADKLGVNISTVFRHLKKLDVSLKKTYN